MSEEDYQSDNSVSYFEPDDYNLGLGIDPEGDDEDADTDTDDDDDNLKKPDTDDELEDNELGHLEFNILSNALTKKMGYPIGVDATDRDVTGEHGIYSLYMGPYEDEDENVEDPSCIICGEKFSVCAGHFGYIKLEIPVIHPLYQTLLHHILSAACHQCGNIIVTETRLKTNLMIERVSEHKRSSVLYKELTKIRKQKNKEKCPHCASVLYPIVFKKADKTFFLNINDELHKIPYDEILSILKCIKSMSKTMHYLGFTGVNIDGMIIKYLTVVPNIARPPVYVDGAQCDDDLTTMYTNIIKVNYNIKKLLTGKITGKKVLLDPIKQIDVEYSKLINFIETLINNKQIKGKKTGGANKNYKTFRGRIKGKQGRMRRNVQGKRNNFTARTVASAGPELELDEIGVPEYIAKRMTTQERVNQLNIEELSKLIHSREARYIIRGGEHLDTGIKKMVNFELQLGDMVERPLKNGDWAIMHRHPTLHSGSMQGVRVRITSGYTFKANLSQTTPMNLDFDGDELNLYVAEGPESAAEIKELMHINKRLLSVQNSAPMVALVQDALLGSYLLTYENPILELDQFNDCLYHARKEHMIESLHFRAKRNDFINLMKQEKIRELKRKNYNDKYIKQEVKGMDFWRCGKLVFSSLFPEDFQYEHEGMKVQIKDGILLSGALNKATLGRSLNSIIHVLAKEYGCQTAADFITETQWLINRWLQDRGFSVGFRDCEISDRSEIESILDQADIEVEAIYKRPGFHNKKKHEQYLETTISTALDKVKNTGQRLAAKKVLCDDNRLKIMCDSGSKGQPINLSQITGIVGQQKKDGKRMEKELTNGKRALAYFDDDSESPESRGFVKNSYLRGLTPAEFFWHAMGGREGLLGTACKTADTGYLMRKAVKTLEDLVIQGDGTIRTTDKSVISFSYGENFDDPSRLVEVEEKMEFLDISRMITTMNKKYELERDKAEDYEFDD